MPDESPHRLVEVVASAVIYHEEKFLLVQEEQAHFYGKWNFPGGRVDEGESLEQTVERETFEEAGVKVKAAEPLMVAHYSIDRPVLHAFRAVFVGGELKPQAGETLAVKWFSYDEVLAMKGELRDSTYMLAAIEKLLA